MDSPETVKQAKGLLTAYCIINTRMVCGGILGKTVLVTGGAGSIGSEICRQMATVTPKRIVVFDLRENDAYLLKNEIMRQYDDIDVCVEIGGICQEDLLRDVFEKYRPEPFSMWRLTSTCR